MAILLFRNSTPYGGQYSSLHTDQLINKCINANLQWVVFATRSHLDRIIQEYELTAAGAVDPSTAIEIGKLEGINFFITGNLTQISEQTTSPSFVERAHKKTVTVRDSTGKEVKKTERIVDEARWVRYQGSVYDLPENKRGLLDAATEPKSADMLINDGIRIIAEKMSQKITRYYR